MEQQGMNWSAKLTLTTIGCRIFSTCRIGGTRHESWEIYFTDYNELVSAIVGIHSSTRRRASMLRHLTVRGLGKYCFRWRQIHLVYLEEDQRGE